MVVNVICPVVKNFIRCRTGSQVKAGRRTHTASSSSHLQRLKWVSVPERFTGEGRQEDTHSLVQQPPAKTQMGQCAGEVHR